MTDMLEGGCFCKAVRYRLAVAPMFVHCCHCQNCQAQTGSAFVLNAFVETNGIELLGEEPRPTTVESGSGKPHDIYRCTSCLTAVWSDYGRKPGIRFVRIGTLDDPAALSPDVHIFTRSRLPWITLPDGVPSFEVYYDMKELWPAESLERYRVAVKRPRSEPGAGQQGDGK